jgi:CspA family cold shock protein
MRERGVVKWFNAVKGYGFLGRPHGPDVFVHFSNIDMEGYKQLSEGDEVEFDVVKGEKGPMATAVKIISQSGSTSGKGKTD